MTKKNNFFLEGINEQNTSAFDQLYNNYYRVLVLYAKNFLSSQEVAEDLVQDLFATMWEKKLKFNSLSSFQSYLYNSIRNASINYLKHKDVEISYLERLTDNCKNLDGENDNVSEEEIYRLLFRAIDKLPSRCREVFLLHIDGKRNDEIAEALGITVATVKNQKKRAIHLIKEQLGSCCYLISFIDIM